jgi:hypothetical protein
MALYYDLPVFKDVYRLTLRIFELTGHWTCSTTRLVVSQVSQIWRISVSKPPNLLFFSGSCSITVVIEQLYISREYKFTLGQDMKHDCLILVRSIYRANNLIELGMRS